jgi:hypothetical protein
MKMSQTTRRTFIGGSLAFGAALALPGRALALTSTASAGSFFQMMGVNARTWAVDNAWPQRLLELGLPNVRTKVGQSKDYISKIAPWLSTGGKINATIVATNAVNTLDKDEATKNLAFLKNYVGLRYVSGIEGPNEFNENYQICPDWAVKLRDFVQWTHSQVRSDSAFGHIPLVGPSIWKRQSADYQALGDISRYVDRGCIHFYSGRQRPTRSGLTNTMQGEINKATSITPGRPMWMTETGWQAPSGNIPISLRAQAKYVVRNYFDAFGFGIEKLFTYQLMDNDSKLWGLCSANGTPKPSFFALKNLAALFKDPASGARSLAYSVSSAPSSLKVFTFSKSDGSFLLAYYLDVDSFDLKAGRDIETEIPVMFHFPSSARKIEVYKPTFSSEVQLQVSGAETALFASDQLTVLKIWF